MEYYDKRRGEGQKATPPPPYRGRANYGEGGGGIRGFTSWGKATKGATGGEIPNQSGLKAFLLPYHRSSCNQPMKDDRPKLIIKNLILLCTEVCTGH